MDSAESSFRRVLSLLEHDWVRDFLFPRESQIEQLHFAITTALASAHPTTACLRIQTLDASPTTRHHALDEFVRVLFAPTFTTGDITVSFQVFDRIKSNKTFRPNVGRYFGRSARDDKNNLHLNVTEHSPGYTEVTYGSLTKAGLREHGLMIFRSEGFESVAKNIRNGYDADEIRKALVYCAFAIEARTCPVCGSDDFTRCECRLPTRRKRHPLDYETDLKNLQLCCGVYDGVMSVGTYCNGMTEFFATYPSQSQSRITDDDEERRKLSQWAMNDAAKARPMNLFKFCVPHDLDCVPLDEGWSVWDGTSGFGLLSPRPERRSEPPLISLVSEDTDFRRSESKSTSLFLKSNEPVEPSSRTEETMCKEHSTEEEDSSCQSAKEADLTTPVVPSVPTTASSQSTDRVIAALPAASQLAAPPPMTTSVFPDAQQLGHLRVARKLPMLVPAISKSEELNHERADPHMTEAERKQHLKKLRNRASAHRSNLKKKLLIEKMKADLEACTQKAASLRKRELALREENLSLRKALC